MSTLELSQSGPGPLRLPTGTAELPRVPAVSSTADTAIRASTAAVVPAVAGIAAYISYRHAYIVVRQYGENGATAMLEPGTIDGLVYASSMVILHAARHRLPVPRLARWMLALGIAASLAVNVAQGWSHGLVGAAAAAWPAVALVGSYEMLAWMIRTAPGGGPDREPSPDHRGPQPDQPGINGQPAVSPVPEAVPAAAFEDIGSPGTESLDAPLLVARTVSPVRGREAGGPACPDHADRGDQARGPVRESTGHGEPARPPDNGPAGVTPSAGEVDAAAVAAYCASLQAGKPLSERKLAASFGRTSRRWARNRMAEARQEPVADRPGARTGQDRHSSGVLRPMSTCRRSRRATVIGVPIRRGSPPHRVGAGTLAVSAPVGASMVTRLASQTATIRPRRGARDPPN